MRFRRSLTAWDLQQALGCTPVQHAVGRRFCSERHGLAADVVVPFLQPASRDLIHRDPGRETDAFVVTLRDSRGRVVAADHAMAQSADAVLDASLVQLVGDSEPVFWGVVETQMDSTTEV